MPVGGLDGLRSLLQQKKAEKQQLVGDKKYVRKSELEEARLKRIREEEEAERLAKVRPGCLQGVRRPQQQRVQNRRRAVAAASARSSQRGWGHQGQQGVGNMLHCRVVLGWGQRLRMHRQHTDTPRCAGRGHAGGQAATRGRHHP
jgi:hypothetical protein